MHVLAAKAADMMYDRANKVDNVLGSGASLDEMPSDLGLAGVAGHAGCRRATRRTARRRRSPALPS